jgi:hypothetical protein
MLTMLRHNTRIDAGLTKMGLRSIVNDGVPPTLAQVRDLFPDVSSEELVDHWQSAMLQYQRENAKLFDVVYDTIDLASDWEMIDIEHIQSNFISGAERDGNGLLKWIRSFHDLNSDALQTNLRVSNYLARLLATDFSRRAGLGGTSCTWSQLCASLTSSLWILCTRT